MTPTIQQLSINLLKPHPENPRTAITDAEILELADSIKANGILTPLTVRAMGSPTPAHYQILAGHRRVAAAQKAGLAVVPCFIRNDLDDKAAYELMFFENVVRENLNPLDEARGYKKLMESGMKVADIAARAGKKASPRLVYQTVQLLTLEKDALKLLEEGKISKSHAVLMAPLGKDQQQTALRTLVRDSHVGQGILSVRDFEKEIRQHILINLSSAPFKWDDAELNKTAGVCTACPKRIENGKSSYCSDGACYSMKTTAFLKRIEQQFIAKGIKPVYLSSDYGTAHENAAKLWPGLKAHHEWKAAGNKKCKHTVTGIVVAGNDLGSTPTVCAERKCRTHFPAAYSPASRREKKPTAADHKKQLAAKRTAEINKRFHQLLFLAGAKANITKLPPAVLKRIGEEWDGRLHSQEAEAINKEAQPLLKSASYEKRICLGELTDTISWNMEQIYPQTLQLAHALGIDHKKILRQATAEYDAKAKVTATAATVKAPPKKSQTVKPKAKTTVKKKKSRHQSKP